MGKIIRNNIEYGGGSSLNIVELTQAEYDALGDSKNSNGVIYCITDGKSSEGGSGGAAKVVELTKAEYDALPDSKYSDDIIYCIIDINGEDIGGGGSSSASVEVVELTQSEWDSLGNEKYDDDVIYVVTDGEELEAHNMAYDGSITGLGNDVQEAIDNLNDKVGSGGGLSNVKLTQAEYDALPETKNSDNVIYTITDGEEEALDAENIKCTDASGEVSDVQSELDKHNEDITLLNQNFTSLIKKKVFTNVTTNSGGSFDLEIPIYGNIILSVYDAGGLKPTLFAYNNTYRVNVYDTTGTSVAASSEKTVLRLVVYYTSESNFIFD